MTSLYFLRERSTWHSGNTSCSYSLGKKVFIPRNEVPFGDYSYSISLWCLKAGWLAGFMVFLSIVCIFFCFNVNFAKFVMTFIDIKKMAAWAYLNIMDGNCGKSGQTNLIFCMMLSIVVALCMHGQYMVFATLAAIITTRHRGMLATRHCRRSTGSSAHLSSRDWQSSPSF